jgi:hypothetical protein
MGASQEKGPKMLARLDLAFDCPMILFQDIVEVLHWSMFTSFNIVNNWKENEQELLWICYLNLASVSLNLNLPNLQWANKVQNTTKKRPSTMKMQPAITEKRPSTRQAVTKKWRDTMPTSHTATTYMLCIMRKRQQRIMPESTHWRLKKLRRLHLTRPPNHHPDHPEGYLFHHELAEPSREPKKLSHLEQRTALRGALDYRRSKKHKRLNALALFSVSLLLDALSDHHPAAGAACVPPPETTPTVWRRSAALSPAEDL